MPKKKNKLKPNAKKSGLTKIATLTTKSISTAFTSYKKNKELEKRRTLAIQYFLNAKKENKKSKKLFKNLISSLIFN